MHSCAGDSARRRGGHAPETPEKIKDQRSNDETYHVIIHRLGKSDEADEESAKESIGSWEDADENENEQRSEAIGWKIKDQRPKQKILKFS